MQSMLSFCRNLPRRSFSDGDVLLPEGGKTGVLYILVEGQIDVMRGQVLVATVSEPGAIFGEMSVLLDSPHTATVKSHGASTTHVIENAAEFLRSHPDVTYLLAKLLSQRLFGVTTYLVDLKNQFQDEHSHLGMVDEVLDSLLNQQDEGCTPGSERDPDTSI